MKGKRDSEQSGGRLLASILALYLLLTLAYGVVNPLFEVPDEQVHFFTVQYVAENRRLPVVPQPAYSMPFIPTRPAEWLGQEAAQPPLYYLLSSLVVGAIDSSAAKEQITYNPFVRLGDAGAAANRNGFVHGPWESWPWRGYAAAAHLLRALSSLMGLGTLILIFKTAAALWPDNRRRSLLAVALAAFLPQFIFLHSSITNDALIILLATAALYQLVRLELLTRSGNGAGGGRYLLLGVTIGLAALTKTQGIVLLGFTLAVILVRGLGHSHLLKIGRKVVLVALPAVLLAGWLWWRNWMLYGDLTAANQFVAIAGGDRGYSIFEVLGEFSGFWLSLFALFGWFNVRAPEIAYWLWTAVVIAALIGALGDAPWRRTAGWWSGLTSPAVLLSGWVMLVFAALVSFAMRTPAMQGRLLLPAVLPLALGMAFGLERLVDRVWPAGSRILPLFPAIGLLTAIFTLVVVIPPVYAFPERLSSFEGVPIETPLDVSIAESGRLGGVNLSSDSVESGGELEVTLFWESMAPLGENAFEFVQLVALNGERLTGLDTFHGRGLYPTGLWRPGEIIVDPVLLSIPLLDPGDPAGCFPQGLGLDVGLTGREGSLPNQFGQTTSRIRTVRLAPYALGIDCEAGLPHNGDVLLGDEFVLSGFSLSGSEARPGETVDLRLVWEAQSRPAADYTVFVQLLDGNGEIAAQFDGPPNGGSLPTGLWWPGDRVVDTRLLPLPADLAAGSYRLVIGLYRLADFYRLPAVDRAAGEVRLPDDAIEVGRVEVK